MVSVFFFREAITSDPWTFCQKTFKAIFMRAKPLEHCQFRLCFVFLLALSLENCVHFIYRYMYTKSTWFRRKYSMQYIKCRRINYYNAWAKLYKHFQIYKCNQRRYYVYIKRMSGWLTSICSKQNKLSLQYSVRYYYSCWSLFSEVPSVMLFFFRFVFAILGAPCFTKN